MMPVARRPARGADAVAGPANVFTADDLEDFGHAITHHLGHFQDLSRREDLAAILRLRMRLTGCTLYGDYRQMLEASPEWEALAPLLTVPETYFFRMPSHFEALAEDVLPQVIRANHARRSLRILSAGCATGEEPYTLRILLNERFPQLADWDVAIVGVDLSLAALERARAGVYTEWSLRATSAARRGASFSHEGKHFRLKPQARTGVTFRRENLLAPPSSEEAKFDVIFCRNVLIYFTDDAIRTTIARLTERLAPSGYLFLGPAESLRGISDDFQLCQGNDVFYYRLRASAERRIAPLPTSKGVARSSLSSPSPPRFPAHAATVTATAEPADPALDTGIWYTSIQQSWQRLAALVPSPDNQTVKPPIPPAKLAVAPDSEEAFFALVAAERFAQALDLLESMTSSSQPDGAANNLLRATMLTNLGRYEEAERECKLLLAADATHAGAHFLLGLCCEQTGALRDAEEHMATALYLDPSFPMAHLHRGLIARRQRDDAAAGAFFRKALRAIEHEESKRLALFGGGLSRESLKQLCLRELDALQTKSQSLSRHGA